MQAIMNMLLDNSATTLHPFVLAIHIVSASAQYSVDPELMTRIVIVESNGRPNAVNTLSSDYGLMQVHGALGRKCGPDWDCNLRQGAAILAKTHRTCEYNLGPKGKQRKYRKTCEGYERKIRGVK